MDFFQQAPTLGNQFTDDALFQEYVARKLPTKHQATYIELGEQAGGELYRASLADRLHEPVLTQWDPWGHRIDHIEVSPLWKQAQAIATKYGLVAAGYETAHGELGRIHQFAMNYLVQPSLDVYSCPLAMTDGAARTILASGNQALIDMALARLLSRDSTHAWTSGQWMTERTGGSDVGTSETQARLDENGQWRLHGTKWFTSATTSEMSLVLARPENNPPGSRGLALFFVRLRDDEGKLNGIEINRLKDKLGTRKVPTAELTLLGTPATLVSGDRDGVRNIAPMLGVTRTWNAMAAAWSMRRAVALVRDYAAKRKAFGAKLCDKPLHQDTIAGMVAEAEAGFHLAFRCAELLGKVETKRASERELSLFRIITAIAKLTTGKQVVAVISEALECFGGAGYIEDTGLPRMLADAQVLPIWEGTTNVLSLDTLRSVTREPSCFDAAEEEVHLCCEMITTAGLQDAKEQALAGMASARSWLTRTANQPKAAEAGARRFAMTLGRSLSLALMCSHAQWAGEQSESDRGRQGSRAVAAARRFAAAGVDCFRSEIALNEDDAALLTRG